MSKPAASGASESLRGVPEIEQQSLLFIFSGFMFRLGLALATFEQVRPFFGMQVSDYCFFLSLILFFSKPKSRLLEVKGSGVLLAGSLILSAALLSLRNASSLSNATSPLARLFVLFGLFSPLALVHSKDIWRNVLFVIGGIFANCGVALLQAWVYPGIVDALSINPTQPDISDIGRLQALTSHPNILGFSASLAVLIAVVLLSSETGRYMRGRLMLVILVCTLAALLSRSRTFILALVAGLLVFGLSRRSQRKAVLGTLVVIIVVFGTLNYLAPEVLSEYSGRLGSTGGDFAPDYGRLVAAVLAIGEISEKPILGWGPDHLAEAGLWLNPDTGELAGVHNSLLLYWHGVGALGAIGLLMLFASATRRAVQLLKMNLIGRSREALHLALACYGLLFVICNVHPILYNRFLFVPVFVFSGFSARLWNRFKVCPVAHGRAATQLTPSVQTSC